MAYVEPWLSVRNPASRAAIRTNLAGVRGSVGSAYRVRGVKRPPDATARDFFSLHSKTAPGVRPNPDAELQVAPSRTRQTRARANHQVLYDDKVWETLWWTEDEIPGEDTWGPWQEIATTEDGTALWTPSRVFHAADLAVFNGELYEAQWWTRDEEPTSSDPWGPWVLVP